jgi:hypothetical protein
MTIDDMWVSRSCIFMWVRLVVSIYPLIEVGTSLLLTLVDSRRLSLTLTLLGAMGTMATIGSYRRSRCMSPSRFLLT